MLTHSVVSEKLGLSASRLEFPDEFVPVVSRSARQGDVFVRRVDAEPVFEGVVVGREGVTVVQGDNAHILHALDAGTKVSFVRESEDTFVVGFAVVEGGNAFFTHTQEHGSMELTAGVWEFRCPQEVTISGFVRVTD